MKEKLLLFLGLGVFVFIGGACFHNKNMSYHSTPVIFLQGSQNQLNLRIITKDSAEYYIPIECNHVHMVDFIRKEGESFYENKTNVTYFVLHDTIYNQLIGEKWTKNNLEWFIKTTIDKIDVYNNDFQTTLSLDDVLEILLKGRTKNIITVDTQKIIDLNNH